MRSRDLRKLVESKGYELLSLEKTGAQHFKAFIRDGTNQHLVFFSGTPGDWRADLNALSGKQLNRPHGQANGGHAKRPHLAVVEKQTKEQIRIARIARKLSRSQERERIRREREERAAAKAAAWNAWLAEHDDIVHGVGHYMHTPPIPAVIAQASALLARDKPVPPYMVAELREKFAKYEAEERIRAKWVHLGEVGKRINAMWLKTLSIVKTSKVRYISHPNEHCVRLESDDGARLTYTGATITAFAPAGDVGEYAFRVVAHGYRDGLPETTIARVRLLRLRPKTKSRPQKSTQRRKRPNAARAGTWKHYYASALEKLNKAGKTAYVHWDGDITPEKLTSLVHGVATYRWGKRALSTEIDRERKRIKLTRLR